MKSGDYTNYWERRRPANVVGEMAIFHQQSRRTILFCRAMSHGTNSRLVFGRLRIGERAGEKNLLLSVYCPYRCSRRFDFLQDALVPVPAIKTESKLLPQPFPPGIDNPDLWNADVPK